MAIIAKVAKLATEFSCKNCEQVMCGLDIVEKFCERYPIP